MKIEKEKVRTVPAGIEYLEEDINRKYEVYYQDLIKSPKYEKGGEFTTFDEAYNAALEFAGKIACDKTLTVEDKERILKSIMIYDSLERVDVTTAELGNNISTIINKINK